MQIETKRHPSNNPEKPVQGITHKKSGYYETKQEELLRVFIQKIANGCFLLAEDPLRAKEYINLDQILSGKISMCDLKALCQRRCRIPDLPPLPLSPPELKALKKIIKHLPITAQNITLMDVLGLTIHSKLVVLSASRVSVYSSKFTEFKNSFFRLWNSAMAVQYFVETLECRPDQYGGFIQSLECFLEGLHVCQEFHLDAQSRKQLVDLEHAITILIRLWSCEHAVEFLHRYYCDQIKELNLPLPKDNYSPQERYQGMQSFADFMICVFEKSPYSEMAGSKLNKIIEKISCAYDFIYPRHRHQQTDLLLQEITQTQGQFMQTAVRIVKHHAQQKYEIRGRIESPPPSKCARLTSIAKKCLSPVGVFLSKVLGVVGVKLKKPVVKPSCFSPHYDLMQCVSAVFHCAIFCQALNHLIFLLDQYVKASFPLHETVQIQLIRTDILNKLCLQYIEKTQAPSQEHMIQKEVLDFLKAHCPEKELFPAEMQQMLESLCLEIAKDVRGIFTVNSNIMEYVQYKKMELNTVEDHINVFHEYGVMYPHYKLLVENIYISLNNLQEVHNQKLIQFIEQLPLELYVAHQEKILTFFESFLLNCTKHICILALLKHSLDKLLLKETQESTASFLEPLLSYLLMQKFEEAFLNKIAQAGLFKPAKAAPLAPVVVMMQDVNPSKSIYEELEVVKKIKVKTKKQAPVLEVPVSLEQAVPLEHVQQTTAPVREALYLRRGLKIDKIVALLGDYGYQPADARGSHVTFENKEDNNRVIIPIHRQRPYLSGVVRRDVMKRVNSGS